MTTTPDGLRDAVHAALSSVQGTAYHLPPGTLAVLTEKLTDALTPFMAAQRKSVLREAADAVAQLIDDGEHDPDCLVDELRRMARAKVAQDG